MAAVFPPGKRRRWGRLCGSICIWQAMPRSPADLTDPGVVFEIELQAAQGTTADADPRTYAEQAQELYDYHAILLGLMEAELGNDPTDAQQAVYDAQARKVEEMARFREAAGIGTRSTAIWAN